PRVRGGLAPARGVRAVPSRTLQEGARGHLSPPASEPRMYLAVVAIHVILSLLLILVIIVQPGKGGDVGAAFGGGGSSSVFGPRGPTSIFARATTVVAVGFMVTSVILAIYSNRELLAGSNVLEELERRSGEQAQPT